MTSRSTFIIIVICGLFLAAVLARNGEVLLLALPFLVYLIVGLLRCPDRLVLRATRMISAGEVAAGEPFEIQLQVENAGRLLTNLVISDVVWPGMRISQGTSRQTVALAPKQRVELGYVGHAARGLYRWNTTLAKASDPCGLFEVNASIAASGGVRVRPAAMKLRGVSIKPRSTLHAPGPMPARLPGSGTDFWAVREYRPGDPLRRLNWRLAGRYPRRLYTNEYEGEEIVDYGLILDARRLTNAQEVDEGLFEASISAATSLAESFLKHGNRVALLVYGEAPLYLLPGSGKRQLNLVRQSLSQAKLSRHLPARYLESFPARLFPSRSVLLMFSVVETGDLDTYRRLRSYGYDVLLVSPDPIEYASRQLSRTTLNELAVRAARLERMLQLNAIVKLGISVIDWQVGRPLDILLRRSAQDTAHRRNL